MITKALLLVLPILITSNDQVQKALLQADYKNSTKERSQF
jgi:hypothetical protein